MREMQVQSAGSHGGGGSGGGGGCASGRPAVSGFGVVYESVSVDVECSVTSNLLGNVGPKSVLTEEEMRGWRRQGSKPLGSGSYGTVWLGLLPNAFRVAVKEVPAKEASGAEAELVMLQELRHPHIVQYLGHIAGAAVLQLFMEVCDGGSVKALVRSTADGLSTEAIRRFVREALLGLEYLHTATAERPAVVHRDVKGENMLLTSAGVLKLADFGCGKWLDATLPRTAVGTPVFMAPEVADALLDNSEDDGAYDVRCDVWSLGCTVIEMLGSQPWSEAMLGKAVGRDIFAVMHHIVSSGAAPAIPPHADPEVRRFTQRCLVRDGQQRPHTVELLGDTFVAPTVQFAS